MKKWRVVVDVTGEVWYNIEAETNQEAEQIALEKSKHTWFPGLIHCRETIHSCEPKE